MQPITLDLAEPRDWHDTTTRKLTIKPPSTRLYLKLGDPRVIVRNSDGAGYYVEKDDVIRQYVEAMVDHEGGVDFVNTLSLVDGKRVKGAVLGFFDQADAMIFAKSSGSSPST